MKVFVTGGAGFIGSHVADYLLSLGHTVIVVDNLFSGRDHWQTQTVRPELAVVDILDRPSLSELFSRHKPEAVFHLAAHHYLPFCEKNPSAAYDLNIGGTVNVLCEASRTGVDRVFFASTADVMPPHRALMRKRMRSDRSMSMGKPSRSARPSAEVLLTGNGSPTS